MIQEYFSMFTFLLIFLLLVIYLPCLYTQLVFFFFQINLINLHFNPTKFFKVFHLFLNQNYFTNKLFHFSLSSSADLLHTTEYIFHSTLLSCPVLTTRDRKHNQDCCQREDAMKATGSYIFDFVISQDRKCQKSQICFYFFCDTMPFW